MHYDVRAV